MTHPTGAKSCDYGPLASLVQTGQRYRPTKTARHSTQRQHLETQPTQ